MSSFEWGTDALTLVFRTGADPLSLSAIRSRGVSITMDHVVPLVEVLSVSTGHRQASRRLTHTEIGAGLRYVSHDATSDASTARLKILTRNDDHGVEAEVLLEAPVGAATWRSTCTVRNTGDSVMVLQAVTSFSTAVGTAGPGGKADADTWDVVVGESDWLAEGRWQRKRVRSEILPSIREQLTGHDPRGSFEVSSTGTWSTGVLLPTGVLESRTAGIAWAWQIEHNGAWRWEVAEDTAGLTLSLAGPTDRHAAFSVALAPGDEFTTVPAGLAVATTFDDAIAELTAHRRWLRTGTLHGVVPTVVFNDYMNTLNGDPTESALVPLIAAAADAGAETFCIDAGWYADGYWWDSVGRWVPSAVRFPRGLGFIMDEIRRHGMTPGLWLEPEVVGVNSLLVAELPSEAFLQRHGQPIVEHQRLHLDLRHAAARAHLDGVVDRLVTEYGIGFFKLDYNVDPGPGTDRSCDSVGAGLLAHNRAHLEWLDAVRERHPHLVIENCASGAMRMDYAMMSRLDIQSTSDQQEHAVYPPIAAAAPLSLAPEQAASWAYPQPWMSDEEIVACMVTSMLGSFYLSGHLDQMDPRQLELVRDGVSAAKQIRAELATSLPFWPLGLPAWDEDWTSVALRGPGSVLVSVWHQGTTREARLSIPSLRGLAIEVKPIFPRSISPWSYRWDASTGELVVRSEEPDFSARTLRLVAIGGDNTQKAQ